MQRPNKLNIEFKKPDDAQRFIFHGHEFKNFVLSSKEPGQRSDSHQGSNSRYLFACPAVRKRAEARTRGRERRPLQADAPGGENLAALAHASRSAAFWRVGAHRLSRHQRAY